MADAPTLRTERLVLRPWTAGDLAPFAAMSADPEVMAHFPSTLDRAQSEAAVARIAAHFARHGFGAWAVEIPGRARFAGLVGLSVPSFAAPFTPCVEVLWRLARAHWGQGYASEGARAALAHGFGPLGLAEILSFTVVGNLASRAVMERIGMRRDPDGDFDHPSLPEGHRLRRHVLYRIGRDAA